MKPTDKRLLFPFGFNLMTPLQQLREMGLSVRLTEDGKLMVKPTDKITPRAKDLLKGERQAIVEALDQELREDAMGKLPFPGVGTGPGGPDAGNRPVENLGTLPGPDQAGVGKFVGQMRYLGNDNKWTKWADVCSGDSVRSTWNALLLVPAFANHVERRVKP